VSDIKFFRLMFPFLLALVITYLARRPVKALEKRRVSRSLSIIIVYFILIAVVTVLLILVLPRIVGNIREIIPEVPQIYEKYSDVIDMVLGLFSKESAIKVLENSVSILFDMFLSFILAFYMIRDKEIISDFILSFFPVQWRKEVLAEIHEISRIISGFVTGQLLVAVLVGALETVGLMIIGVKYPFVMGFIGGAANIIPVIGPFIGAIPAILVALMESPYKALFAAGVFLIVQQIDNNFLTPRIVEGRLGLHPIVTLSVVSIAALFWGIGGVLLSLPFTAVIVSVIKRIYSVKVKNKGNGIF